MRSWVLIVAGGVLIALLAAGTFMTRPPPARPSGDIAASGAPMKVLYPAPPFALTDQQGRPLTSQSLRGRPYIASFLFTTCRTLCPLLSAKLVMLQRRLAQPQLRFVSFSVDPANDTQEALAAYHQKWNRHEQRWLLARTEPESLARLADGFGVAVEKGDTTDDPIIHSSTFLLVSAEGQVVGAFNSIDEDALSRLARAVDEVLGASTPPMVTTDGALLVHSLGCLGCHADTALAPELQGVPRTVRLETGASVDVDVDYLRESLVSPGKKRVAGFSLVMPAYGQKLTGEQIDGIVSFLAAQPVLTPLDAATAEPALAEDPVCHMKVRVTDSTPHVELDGGAVVHFCSAMCRDRFLSGRR